MINAVIMFFLYMLDTSILGSVLITILLIVKRPLRDLISARVFHILWLLIFVRLLMPIQIQSPFSISNLMPERMQMVSSYQENQPLYMGFSSTYQYLVEPNGGISDYKVSDNASAATPANLQRFLLVIPYIWITGCAVSVLAFMVLNIRSGSRLKGAKRVLDPAILVIVEQCCARLHIKKRIPLYMNSVFKSPCISGVSRPAIYLPEDIGKQISPDQLQHIILHELAHYKRGDLICNLISLLAAFIHWFNPLVWLAVREMRYDREVACDTLVMEVLGEFNAIPYGMTIIDLSRLFCHKQRLTSLASFNESSGQMERRIKMIQRFKKGSYKLPLLAIVWCVIVGAAILTGAVSKQPSPDNMANLLYNERIKDKLVVIDPAHGGDDFGGIYPLNQSDTSLVQVKEKDLNLDISLKLYEKLKKSGIRVEITRMDDRTLTLDDRINMANGDNVALVLSIHCNQANNELANGTSTSFYSGQDRQPPGITSGRFARLLQNELLKQLQTNDLGVKAGNFRLLKEINAPSAMVDVAFLSNESDRRNLMDETFRGKAAQALCDGVITSLNEMVAGGTGTSENES